MTHCIVCSRRLTTKESQDRGMGDKCAAVFANSAPWPRFTIVDEKPKRWPRSKAGESDQPGLFDEPEETVIDFDALRRTE